MKDFSKKQAGILNRVDLKTFKGKLLYWTFFGILVIVALITFLPAIWMVFTAFKSTQEIYSSTSFLPANFSLAYAAEKVVTAWNVLDLKKNIVNTLLVSLGNVVFSIAVCGLAGFVLSKKRVPGIRVVFVLAIWTMMMPGAIRTVPQYMSYLSFPFVFDDKLGIPTNYNILDTYLPIWLGVTANSFNIVLFKNNFDAVSDSIVEAASIDGCGNLKIFLKIMLPIALPVVIYVSIEALSIAWADYFTPYIVLKSAEKMTVPAKIFMIKSDTTVTTNIYMMGLIFASIPALLIFCAFQKYIVGGITLGGVKG